MEVGDHSCTFNSCQCVSTDLVIDISSRNMVFSCNNLSTVTQEYLFQVLGAPVSEQLTRLDGGQLSEGLPKSLVKAAEWIGWIDEDEDLRLFDFGDSLFQGKEPAKPAHLGSLRAPETIFEKSFDYRIDLWHAGCMVSFLDHTLRKFC